MDGWRKTAVFREVNDRMDELLQRFDANEEAPFLCECPSGRCARRVWLTWQAFEEIRREGAYVVAPECALRLAALRRTEHYAVVFDFRPPLAPVAA